MKYIKNLDQGLPVFIALGSQIRIDIIKILKENKEMSLNEIAQALQISNGALTPHIKIMNEAGVISLRLTTMQRGVKKMASLTEDKFVIELFDTQDKLPSYEMELNVGQYSDYKINSPCGLATATELVGGYDSAVFFTYPERFQAEIVWFTDGYITYTFPYLVKGQQKVKEIQLTVEMSGEAPGASTDYPTTIDVSVNGIHLGKDYLPGDRFERRGKLTPSWWKLNYGQYGWMKLYTITDEGSFFNGEKMSNVSLNDLNLDETKTIALTLSCKDRVTNKGGIKLFGKKFGDQEQGIKCKIIYSDKER